MTARMFTLFEDKQTKLKLTQTEMEELLTFKDFFGEGNFILQADGTIIVRHYIGYVSGKHVALQVLPKVYTDEHSILEDHEKDEAVQIFFRLLKWSRYEGIKEIPNTQTVAGLNCDLLEIFISLFINQFIRLFLRNPYRQYLENNEDVAFIRGRIDFPTTITRCGYRSHLHHVNFDEFTMDNELNSVFKTVILQLTKKTKSEENHKKLLIALSYLDEIGAIKLSRSTFDNIRFNRMNECYKPLLNMAKLFYSNKLPGYRQGDEEVFTFLVPLNKLFEKFIYILCSEIIHESEDKALDIKYQGPQEYLARCQNTKSFLLKPDITVLRNDKGNPQVDLILDAKYKNPKVISQPDVYQMLSYAAHYNSSSIVLLYPVFKNYAAFAEEPNEYIIQSFAREIKIQVYQMDIFQEDLEAIKEALRHAIFTRLFKGDMREANYELI